MGTVIQGTETRELRCALTPAEVAKRAERIAELHEKLDTLEATFGSVRARHKADLEVTKTELAAQLDEYRTRSELRPVRCELVLDFEAKRAELIRTDTGEPVYSRPLNDRERQGGLPFPEGEDDDEASDEHEQEAKGETADAAGV